MKKILMFLTMIMSCAGALRAAEQGPGACDRAAQPVPMEDEKQSVLGKHQRDEDGAADEPAAKRPRVAESAAAGSGNGAGSGSGSGGGAKMLTTISRTERDVLLQAEQGWFVEACRQFLAGKNLHVQNSWSPNRTPFRLYDLNVLRQFVARGGNINAPIPTDRLDRPTTALTIALKHSDSTFSTAHALLDLGAKLTEYKEEDGLTDLVPFYEGRSELEIFRISKKLLKWGADDYDDHLAHMVEDPYSREAINYMCAYVMAGGGDDCLIQYEADNKNLPQQVAECLVTYHKGVRAALAEATPLKPDSKCSDACSIIADYVSMPREMLAAWYPDVPQANPAAAADSGSGSGSGAAGAGPGSGAGVAPRLCSME